MVTDPQDSILSRIAGFLSPLMRPIGLGDWRIGTSLISGFIAKESVVSTMQMLFADGVENALTTLSAVCLMTFSLLYTPCVAAVASIRREMGVKWSIGVVLWQCAIAWIITSLVHLAGILI